MRLLISFLLLFPVYTFGQGGAPGQNINFNVSDSCGFTVNKSITLVANVVVNSNAPIVSVQFKADNTNIGTLLVMPPYSLTYDTAALTKGCHTISATATDSVGNSGIAVVNISVK